MIVNELIVQSILAVLNGEVQVYDAEGGYCTRVVRQVVEHALILDPGGPTLAPEFYRLFRQEHAANNPDPVTRIWARDVQVSMRALEFQIPDDQRTGGDLYFNYAVGGDPGHVGIMLTRDLMFENTSTNRGVPAPGSGRNRVSHISEQRRLEHAEYYRIPPAAVPMFGPIQLAGS